MPEEKQKPQERISTAGIFLVFLGIVLLMQSIHILSWTLWETLARFWPVLLIIAGLNLLLRRYSEWVIAAVVVAILLSSLALAIWQEQRLTAQGSVGGAATQTQATGGAVSYYLSVAQAQR